jgi:hypothetical protein
MARPSPTHGNGWTTKPGTYSVEVQGVIPQAGQWIPEALRTIDFDFANGIQGWVPAHDLAPLACEDGLLISATTGGDPYMTRDNLLVPAYAGDVLDVELFAAAGDAPVPVGVFWGTANSPGFSPQRCISLTCPADGKMHTVRFAMGEHEQWRGQTITSLRLDPTGGPLHAAVKVRRMVVKRAE